jgi:acetyl-CoA carboxylase biotin carboxyl carrier protein
MVVGTASAPVVSADGVSSAGDESDHQSADSAHTISSPIVGTFYSAPSPDADPYVQVGDEVKTGQVLCIVEAMKLMNEIESDVDGVVVEVFGRNAQPVEFGEPLFAVQPA